MRILIITYDWPPRNSIATHRPYSWAKYWSNNETQISVLTAKKKPYDEPLNLILPVIDKLNVSWFANGSFNDTSNLSIKHV